MTTIIDDIKYSHLIKGTTWAQEIAYLALNGGDVERAQQGHTMLRIPYLEANYDGPKVSGGYFQFVSFIVPFTSVDEIMLTSHQLLMSCNNGHWLAVIQCIICYLSIFQVKWLAHPLNSLIIFWCMLKILFRMLRFCMQQVRDRFSLKCIENGGSCVLYCLTTPCSKFLVEFGNLCIIRYA